MHNTPLLPYLQLGESESTTRTDLGVVALRRAVHDRADRTLGRTGEDGLRLLDAVLPPAVLAGRLVEPGANVPLPVLMEVAIRNHMITLHHLDGLFVVCRVPAMEVKHTWLKEIPNIGDTFTAGWHRMAYVKMDAHTIATLLGPRVAPRAKHYRNYNLQSKLSSPKLYYI